MECFTVYADDLKGILSPLFFISQPKNTKGFVELNKIAEINPSRKIDNLDLNDLIPYVGLPETGELEIKTVLKRPYKEVKGRNIIKKGDILFARIEPSIFNKKYIFVDDLQGNDYALTSTEFYIVKAKENVNTKFLFYMFFSKDVFTQIKGRTTGSTGRRRLDKGVFENLLIPFLNIQTQNHIVALMDNAYKIKKQKEAEAKQLLDSINDYVLDELGIKLPELKNKMCYVVYSNDVKNNRIDVYYYQPKFKEVEEAINKGKFDLIKIKDVLEYVKKGIEVGSNAYISEGVPFVRVADIDDYKIKIDETDKKINFGVFEQIKNKYKPRQNEILYSKDGTIGFSVIVEEEKDFITSSGILRLKVKNNVNNYYIKSILSNQIFKIFAEHESIGAVIKHLTPEKFLNIKIPLPPLEIQNKIAEEVKRRIQKAEQLQKEAKEELENAKAEVEKIILGDEKSNNADLIKYPSDYEN